MTDDPTHFSCAVQSESTPDFRDAREAMRRIVSDSVRDVIDRIVFAAKRQSDIDEILVRIRLDGMTVVADAIPATINGVPMHFIVSDHLPEDGSVYVMGIPRKEAPTPPLVSLGFAGVMDLWKPMIDKRNVAITET